MENLKSKAAFTAREIAKCAIFVVLMWLGTIIEIPFWPVPLTFQTVICVLSGLLLGWKLGALSMFCYLFMGTIGIPVFSGGGGFWYVTKLTYGYIIGFVFASAVAGWIAHRNKKVSFPRMIAAAVAAMFVNYIIGTPYFALIWTYYMKNGGVWSAIWTYNIIFMFKDLALCVLAAILTKKLLPILNKNFTQTGKANNNPDPDTKESAE